MVDKSRIMTLFNGGTITFKDGGGKIRDCVEDGHVYSRSVDVNIRCYVEMDDNSTILLEYVAKLVLAESFWDKFGKGEIITPGDGLNYWFGEGDGTTILGTPSSYSPRLLLPICCRAKFCTSSVYFFW